MNFPDALHLAKSKGCSALLSFDLKLAKAAKGRSSVPVMVPWGEDDMSAMMLNLQRLDGPLVWPESLLHGGPVGGSVASLRA